MKRRFKIIANSKSSRSNSVLLQVVYERYPEFDEGIHIAKVRGNTLLEALTKMVDNMQLYFDSDDIEEEKMTPEDIIDRINSENGDGCDMIYQIKNLNTGESYIDYAIEDEEEFW